MVMFGVLSIPHDLLNWRDFIISFKVFRFMNAILFAASMFGAVYNMQLNFYGKKGAVDLPLFYLIDW